MVVGKGTAADFVQSQSVSHHVVVVAAGVPVGLCGTTEEMVLWQLQSGSQTTYVVVAVVVGQAEASLGVVDQDIV
jgi:hypothetical protein